MRGLQQFVSVQQSATFPARDGRLLPIAANRPPCGKLRLATSCAELVFGKRRCVSVADGGSRVLVSAGCRFDNGFDRGPVGRGMLDVA